ncbi:hypothetical protein [Streptomyces sp. NPDC050504]|uniref:hypothetical protein n=1 Tax=Streptomyces sp. NPDC050504 TaxID=3365618 RepID=UPI00378E718E
MHLTLPRVAVLGAFLMGAALTPTAANAATGSAPAPAAQVSAGNADTAVTVSRDARTGIQTATGCHGTTCIHVKGTGLRVEYAVVTNRNGNPVGRGVISSTWDNQTHYGAWLGRGQAWRKDYYVYMNQNNKVCGSIEGIDVACLTIHR